MQQFIQQLGAGGFWPLQTMGNYFRLVACPYPVDVKFYRNAQEVASATQMDTGFYLKPAGGFDRIEITSAQAQTVKIMVLDGDGGYDHFNVDISSALANLRIEQAAAVNDLAAVAVGVAATQLVAADSTRKALRFTNAGSADVYIGGAGVTVAGGAIKIGVGQTWIEDQAAPAAWYGISSSAGQSIKIQELK